MKCKKNAALFTLRHFLFFLIPNFNHMNAPLNYTELYLSTATQRLCFFCRSLIVCNSTCIFLFILILLNFTVKYDWLIFAFFIFVMAVDILLSALTLSLIKDAAYCRVPKVKKQFLYLLSLYLSLFSLILHFVSVYRMIIDVNSLYAITSFMNGWLQLLLISFTTVIALVAVLLPIVQIKSFRFVKLLRHAHVGIGEN
jgi:hypothetical protein